ncbi:hypothetical protein RAS1_38570 [Phycisphaerae bacterium RAS1]|nr:hypothetical protein RAS1_38570 [Phycisphaerae bacterium RAS1]
MTRSIRSRSARAISMTEVVVASLLVSLVLTASLQTVSAARMGVERTGERARGMALAQDLMSEILAQNYSDPDGALIDVGGGGLEVVTVGGGRLRILGAEVEISNGTRSLFNDVSDYDGWTESPPARKVGTVIAGHADWGRRVLVHNVDAADLDTAAPSDTGLKRVQVDVIRDGRIVAQLVSIRSAAWQNVLSKR